MLDFESTYRSYITTIDTLGHKRQTRNAETTSLFGLTLDVLELQDGIFPILQGRQMFWKGVVGELAAFLKGPKSVADFEKQGCNYWKLWGDEDGSLNVDYGNSWLDFNGYDQLRAVVDSLQKDPYGRRHLISGWRPDNLCKLSLPCCHYAYQWYVNGKGELEMLWNQRSADWMIGVPSDIILAALFNLLMAQTVGLKPGAIRMVFGDSHIYEPHWTNAYDYLARYTVPVTKPRYTLAAEATVFNFTPDMFSIVNYEHNPRINFELIA